MKARSSYLAFVFYNGQMANPKGNPQNLKPVRTKNEARKKGRNGGIKSGESRRKKKTVREVMEMMAYQPLTNEKLKKSINVVASGVEEEDMDLLVAATMGLFQSAMKGSEKAYKVIAEYLDDGAIRDDAEEDALSASLRELGENL